MHVLIGVTGSIAASKTPHLVTACVSRGDSVRVVMTDSAQRFVGPETFRSLSGNPVITSLWLDQEQFSTLHVNLAEWADVIAVVPATANIIGKLACGVLDDVLTCIIYAADCPVLVAPAMNTNMWRHPVVQENCRKLRAAGYHLVEPETGRLASGAVGVGRLADIDGIADAVSRLVEPAEDEH